MKKELEVVMKELSEAILENIEASKVEDESKLRKIKAHYRLQKVQEELFAITKHL